MDQDLVLLWKMVELLDNLELYWPILGNFNLDKSTLRGTLVKRDLRPLEDSVECNL